MAEMNSAAGGNCGSNRPLQDAAGNAFERLREGSGEKVREAIYSAARYVSGRATDAAGRQLMTAGEAILRHGPQEGQLADVTKTVSEGFVKAGHYVGGQGMQGMVDDAVTAARRNPFAAVVAGIGVAMLLLRLTDRRR